jgi:hypothetical protein
MFICLVLKIAFRGSGFAKADTAVDFIIQGLCYFIPPELCMENIIDYDIFQSQMKFNP